MQRNGTAAFTTHMPCHPFAAQSFHVCNPWRCTHLLNLQGAARLSAALTELLQPLDVALKVHSQGIVERGWREACHLGYLSRQRTGLGRQAVRGGNTEYYWSGAAGNAKSSAKDPTAAARQHAALLDPTCLSRPSGSSQRRLGEGVQDGWHPLRTLGVAGVSVPRRACDRIQQLHTAERLRRQQGGGGGEGGGAAA